MRPIQTTNTGKLTRWADSYRRCPLYNKTGDRAFGIGLYQVGQARRWRNDVRTVSESCASGVMWWLIAGACMRAHIIDNLPPTLSDVDQHFPGWDVFAGQVMEAQQQVSYSFGQLKGRNNRFSAKECGYRIAALISTTLSLIPSGMMEQGFFDATNIMTRESDISGKIAD